MKLTTKADVDSLAVGDMAPNAFGKLAEVTQIVYRGIDRCGRAFVGYYTRSSPTSEMSCSLKENTVLRHACLQLTSAEINAHERALCEAAGVRWEGWA